MRDQDNSGSAMNPRALTDKVLRRDRLRLWIIGSVCVAAWMLVVMLPWATTMPMLGRLMKHQLELVERGSASAPALSQADRDRSIEVLQVTKSATIATFIGSLVSMFVAAICTVSLVVYSRRATLRQVNARLAEISAQLKVIAGQGS